MGLRIPVIPILTSAIGKFVVSKLNPKAKSVSLGGAVATEAVTRLVPSSTSRDGIVLTQSYHESLVTRAGIEFGGKLKEIIPEGKWEEVGERAVGQFFRAAADELDPE